MAGANQHSIPQAFSRGFRIPGGTKKESKVWLYEKGVAPRLVLIKNEVAVERHFYSEPSADGSTTLDDHITEYENAFAQHLQALRSASPGSAVASATAAEVVAHLTIRNAYLRRTFTMGVNAILGRAVEVFCNEATLRPVLGVDRDAPSERVKDLIDEQLKENPAVAASGLPPRVLHQIAQMILKERFSTFFTAQVPFMAAAFDALTAQAPAFVRNGHNKALSSGLAPDRRMELLRALSWRVWPASDDGLVLPDCVALGMDDDAGLRPLILADLEKVTVVLMPLATERLLVGTRQSESAPIVATFNEAAVAASHTFFIAARRDDKLTLLAERIGATSSEFMNATVGSIFDEFLTSRSCPPTAEIDVSPEGQNAGVAPPPIEGAASPPEPPRYSIDFLSCVPSQATADKVAGALYAVTGSLVQMMPLDRLDGFTFASDYPAALRNLNRGFTASAQLEPTIEEYGVGISMAVPVVRGGIAKTHIVMRGDIAHALISEDERLMRCGLHTVVGQLAYAACDQILDEALPGVLCKRIDDRYDAYLYLALHAAWTGYFSSRASAAFDPQAGLAQQELLVSVLKRAQSDIPAARFAYRFHGNIDRLLEIALLRIADVLRFSGTVLGHYDGLQKSFLEQPAVAIVLEQIGLRDWLMLFDSDLSRLWDRRGKWSSFNEFLTLNRHVERLFWLYHLFPWKRDDGQIHITVPLGSDASRLVGLRPFLRRSFAQMWQWSLRLLSRVTPPLRRRSLQ